MGIPTSKGRPAKGVLGGAANDAPNDCRAEDAEATGDGPNETRDLAEAAREERGGLMADERPASSSSSSITSSSTLSNAEAAAAGGGRA